MEIRHHAYLYAILCKNILEEAGEEEGEGIIRAFTRSYGIARGRRMKEHAASGDMSDFFIVGEWKGRQGENLSQLFYGEDRTVSEVSRCAWYDTWKRYDLLKEGSHYCRYIDKAICEGYGSDFSLDLKEAIGLGDARCIFIWNAIADQKKVEETKREYILPFDFHCEELLKHALAALDGDMKRGVYDKCKAQFIDAFSESGPFENVHP